MIIQHSMVFLYSDDYGYSVLAFWGYPVSALQNGFAGQNFSLLQVFEFLWSLYNSVSGRVFSIFLEIYLSKLGIWYLRFFQIFTILGAVILSFKIAVGYAKLDDKQFGLSVLPIVLFLAIPSSVLVGGVYWFAASSSNLWGSFFLLCGASRIVKNKKLGITSSLILSFAVLFHEQIAFATIVFFFVYYMYNYLLHRNFQALMSRFYLLVPIVMFSCITIFAPGNFRRQKFAVYPSENYFEVITLNLETLYLWLFSHGSVFFLILAASYAVLFYFALEKPIFSATNGLKSVLHIGFLTASYFLLPIGFLFLFLGLYSYLLYKSCLNHEHGGAIFSLFIASIAALFPLVLAPEVPGRALIPFYFLGFCYIVFSFSIFQLRFKYLFYLILLLFFALSMLSYKITFTLFKENYEMSMINDYNLRGNSFLIKNNIDIGNKIILFKPTPEYGRVMAFQKDDIERWMKKYYEIPQHIIFEWRSKFGYTASNCTNKEWMNGIARWGEAAFFILKSPEAERDFAVGKEIKLADGNVRKVIKNQANGETLIVFLDGPSLDGKIVGYPNLILPIVEGNPTNKEVKTN